MKEHGWIEPIVERVVGQVMDSHAAQLRTEIVQRVMEEIAAHPPAGQPTNDNASSASGMADLARAVAEIQSAIALIRKNQATSGAALAQFVASQADATAVSNVVGAPDFLHYYGNEGRHVVFRLRFFGRTTGK